MPKCPTRRPRAENRLTPWPDVAHYQRGCHSSRAVPHCPRRDGGPPHISAILDYDRAAWGDPRACWLFHLLPRKASPRVNAVFWKAYGAVDDGPEARFRSRVYDGLHAGNVLSALRRDERDDLLPLAYDTVRQAAADAAALARGGD